jgi:hypothetical protein
MEDLVATTVHKTEQTLSTKMAVKKFRKDAKAFTEKATSSKEEARRTLIKLGTHTRSGNLKKPYRE